jgi:hypothetical protein
MVNSSMEYYSTLGLKILRLNITRLGCPFIFPEEQLSLGHSRVRATAIAHGSLLDPLDWYSWMRKPLQSSSSSFPDLITARSLASCDTPPDHHLPQGIVRSGGG